MKVWMLFLITLSCSAMASEFNHIKLKPEFEQYLTQPESKSTLSKRVGLKSVNSIDFQSKIASTLLGKSGISTPIPVDGKESLLYEEIRNHLEGSHRSIGLEQVANINRINQQFNLGSSNFSGFSWQKPFGVVAAYADRQVTPNIFGSNWLVMDTFTFEIEASSFLQKLSDAGLSDMSTTEIGAFAGITFKRVYTNWHYANSYQEGMVSDFSKLFLPFIAFNQKGIERMGKEEFMKREDQWTASVGGLITTPPLYNISFSGGVLAQYDFQNATTVQSTQTEQEKFKIGVLSKKSASAGISLELQLDFFKLLKLSLLRYDMNYEYSSGKEFTLGFSPSQWEQVAKENEEGEELRSILKGLSTVQKLEPYVVRLDESSSTSLEQRGSILLWGKLQKSKTEQIRVIKDGVVKDFYKNYAQNVKVVQNLFSRLFSAVIYKILKFPVGTKNASIYSQQITMEYEASHPQAQDPNVVRINSAEEFSFILTQYYNAARTDRWVDRRFKNDVIWFVDHFTTLPKNYKTDIRSELLKGPLMVESHLRVEKAGMHYLLNLGENNLFQKLAKVCRSKRAQDWSQELSRQELLKVGQRGREKCVKEIGTHFLSFKRDYLANNLSPSIARFKTFLQRYYKESQNILDLQEIFGAENTFINGKLQAKTKLGNDFSTVFSSGQFRGLGVIDTYKRNSGTRTPASIISE